MLPGVQEWPTSSLSSSNCCQQQVQEQEVVSPRLAASVHSTNYLELPLCYIFLPQRFHLQAYYDPGEASVTDEVDAVVAGGGAAVATAVYYYHDSADGTVDVIVIACVAYEAVGSPSAATMEIRFD